MKKGDIAKGKVLKTIYPDKGIIELESEEIQIKNAIPGQELEFQITKKKHSKIEAKILEVLKKSDLEDNENPCIHSELCGGCIYQNLSYPNQLRIKEVQIQKLLMNAYGEDFIWEGILPSPVSEAYRNKMEFSFGDAYKDGPLALGMHKRGSHYDIVDIKDCKIVHQDLNTIVFHTLHFFGERKIPYYHKFTHEGLLRHLIIRRSVRYEELLIDIVTASDFKDCEDVSGKKQGSDALQATPQVMSLIAAWKDMILQLKADGLITSEIAGILHTKNNSYADAVVDQGTEVLYGRDYIKEKINGLDFKISAFSFFQTNSLGAEVLYKKAGEYIGETKGKSVFDLYSGTGTIAQLLASYADKVYGIEIIEEAVEAARENAKENGITNCEFLAGDVLKLIDNLEEKPDIIILDPPRDGIHPKALPKIIDFKAEKIIYISCKPSSLARDLVILKEAGYKMEQAVAVDMFPQTAGVEAIALFVKHS